MMQTVFANTASIATPEKLVMKGGRWRRLALRVRVGLMVHPAHGPILIDTGLGPQATSAPGRSLPLRLYAKTLRPQLIPDQSPTALLARYGFNANDVKRIILTHLHADHVACLSDFPQASVIADHAGLAEVQCQSMTQNLRYGVFPELLPRDLALRMTDIRRFDFAELPFAQGIGHDILGDGSMLAVPLPGHATGHIGLCFPKLPTPLLYATDTQWIVGALAPCRAPGWPGSMVAQDQDAARKSTAFAAKFQAAGGTVMLCHDPVQTEYDL